MAQEAEMTIIGMDDVLAVFLKVQQIGRNTRKPASQNVSVAEAWPVIARCRLVVVPPLSLARSFSARDPPPHHENLQALGLSPQAFPSSAEVGKSAVLAPLQLSYDQ
jgi:hypothetical protein